MGAVMDVGGGETTTSGDKLAVRNNLMMSVPRVRQ